MAAQTILQTPNLIIRYNAMNKSKMIPHWQNHSNVQLENRRHRREIDIHIRDRKTLLVDKISSMSGGVKLVLYAQTAPLSEMM